MLVTWAFKLKKIVVFYLKTASIKQGGFYDFKPMYVSEIPILNAFTSEREAITSLVQKCLDARDQGADKWEAKIDDMVAHLYEMTAEKNKIIIGK